jgi:dolichol-phosphate mannosyltransferase
MSADLAVVIPTLNEAGNVDPLYRRLEAALSGIAWEVVFVDDDSQDGTLERIEALARAHPNVRRLQRVGRRGLSSACVEGMLATTAPVVAVMDADLQHDEKLLPAMLKRLRHDDLDIVVASRFAEGATLGTFSDRRERLSRWGNRISRLLTKVELTDPMSGFFVLRRPVLDEVVHALSQEGFKILLDIFASSPRPLRVAEIPFSFGERHSGESKLDTLILLEFSILLSDKLIGNLIPTRFALFVLVGLFGLLVHLSLLAAGLFLFSLPFYWAQAGAAVTAMVGNFYLNNLFTYRDRRLRGFGFVRGLLSFCVACAIGAVVNLQMAEYVYDLGSHWAVAGLVGAVVGSVWNYGVASTFTWKRS